jgi:MoxR-like ATPase
MGEHQVTIEGETRVLPKPFFVIATQNPLHQIGTFPLPESQLDRFLMRISLGYPDPRAERDLLKGGDRRELIESLLPRLEGVQIVAIQSEVRKVRAAEALLDYLQALIRTTRTAPEFAVGLSPRAGLAILQAGQAWALMEGRDYLLPEDLQVVLPSVVGHRLRLTEEQPSFDPAAHLIAMVPVP